MTEKLLPSCGRSVLLKTILLFSFVSFLTVALGVCQLLRLCAQSTGSSLQILPVLVML